MLLEATLRNIAFFYVALLRRIVIALLL